MKTKNRQSPNNSSGSNAPNYLRRGWATLSAALITLLALAACTGATVNDQPAQSASPSEQVVAESEDTAVNQPISQVELVPAAADPIGSPQIIDISKLTADAVVAAQEQVIGNIYQTLLPSVVQIRSSRNLGLPDGSNRLPDIPGFPFEPGPDLPDDFFERSAGTGFVWDDQGHIVTNHHVINGADRVIVIFADRSEFEAEVLGSDPDSDLAVLQINNPDGLPPAVTLGDSDGVRVGQMATAIGNPFGQEFTITSGIISAVGRTIRSGNSAFSIPEVLQTDASINPGNSGGPLLDRRGRVIGVNTQILSRSGSNSGIGFAVPINIAKKVIPALLAEGSFNYAWLGISGTSLTPDVAELMNLPRDTHGALIIELIEDGPAAQSDLRGSDDTERIEGVDIPVGGDVIVSIDGTPIDGIDDLIAYLVGKTRPDQEVIMEVIRGDGERLTIPITLGKRPGSL